MGDSKQAEMWLLRSYTLEKDRFRKAEGLLERLGIGVRKLAHDELMGERSDQLEVGVVMDPGPRLSNEQLKADEDEDEGDWGDGFDDFDLSEEAVARVIGDLDEDDMGAITLEFNSLREK